MSTSIIIPTMNEIIGIQHTLTKVDRNWAEEWIVIDNNSNDGTPEEAKKMGFTVINQTGDGLGDAYRQAVYFYCKLFFWWQTY